MPRRKTEPATSGKGSVIDMKTGELVNQPVIPIICERIRFYRKQNGMEQKAFGELIGAAPNTVNNWEKGRTRPDVSFLPSICQVLGITLQQLYGLENQELALSEREEKLISVYRKLDTGHQFAVDTLADTLFSVQRAEKKQKSRRKVYELPLYNRTLAAGIGDPSEYEGSSDPFYLYEVPWLDRASCVFKVNGDSMEPDYHSGDFVLVERIPDAPELKPGEIGAFAIGNELYIKQYEKDGLHSLNDRYPVMTFDDETKVYLVGRVLSVVDQKDIATDEDVRLYQTIRD